MPSSFDLLIPPLKRALRDSDYETPTPIQQQSIPIILAGHDLLGSAQTGTGKTAAFTLPILQLVAGNPRPLQAKRPRALILAPTRELAAQIGQSISTYGAHLKLRHAVIFGGVGQNPQAQAIARGLDILVATPGRLIDLLGQKLVDLSSVELLVLDEVDRMLDMGFLPDVKRVLAAVPAQRQTLFFSATMPPKMEELARSILNRPERVSITPEQPTVERIDQRILFLAADAKDRVLSQLCAEASARVIVFTQMKHRANRVVEVLGKAGITAAAIHGNKSQGARTKALDGFKSGSIRVLVATDVAARGIDIDGLGLVINYDLPVEAETYVHRIGRTARAGAEGVAISFCSPEERAYLRAIEKLIRREIPWDARHPDHSEAARLSTLPPPPQGGRGQRPPRDPNRPSRDGNRPPRDRSHSHEHSRPRPNDAGHSHGPDPARNRGPARTVRHVSSFGNQGRNSQRQRGR